ncbi:hypothetical protein JCM3263A_21590 [Thermobifida fusca]|jgi:hypothetical protein|uniref:Lipoprotein n=2 Tax=Thermobifida fusca TaxID=2021 RepID=A0A9P2WPB5_THEFU|nr:MULTISPECIES: hypothetical protein [Thermobifida]AAZ57052.1 hypothetical protein Tfu_3019 [Thermobifida fusca YX]EOR69964.1 hypothetical protein TM51_15481 [Thermobifida fusca TM51]MBO2530103.1 hypothetical protein [Thermobifida sp.]MDD6790954.1 hypothetical protein [Thermobifida fusca]PPS94984.1 hypothetical protein BH05_04330 [Thermobifida fusca]
MNFPQKLSTAVAVVGAAALVCGLAGCGSESETASEASNSHSLSAEEAAARLHEAQLSEFQGFERVEEESRTGIYSELDVVRQAAEEREALTLDKPQCADAVNEWEQLPDVQEAPASLALFRGAEGALTHVLLELPEDLAIQAVETVPSDECATYEATTEDGSSHSYRVRQFHVETVGDQSRGVVVEMESAEGAPIALYSLLYREDGRLGSVSMIGGPETEQRLTEFAIAALEHQHQVLG